MVQEIPERLQNQDFRFNKLYSKSKKAIDKVWQSKNNYIWLDFFLKKHISSGGNYGVLGGFGDLIIIDCDKIEAEELVKKNLPKTFSVKTGSGKKHFYGICKDGKNLKVFYNKEKDTLADIQFSGKYVVAPNSTHPNGNLYLVDEDVEIAKIDFQQILDCFANYLKHSHNLVKVKKSLNKEDNDVVCKAIKKRISIADVLKSKGIDTSINPTMCPLGHDSVGKKCFSFTNETFNCFHCGESGSIFHLIMLLDKCKFKAAQMKLFQMTDLDIDAVVDDEGQDE